MNLIASPAENESRRAAALRRIAIVLRDLPEAVSRQLLADLTPETRYRVRREIADLDDVDPVERRRALESFTGSMRRGSTRRSDSRRFTARETDEIQLTHEAHAAPPIPTRPAENYDEAANTGSLAFFDSISDDDLLSLLGDEHPQTQAVVLAQIQPARAAALLPRFSAAQRQDLLTRIGRLPALPEEMLSEIANSFRQRVDRMLAARTDNTLQSLVAAMGAGGSVNSAASSHVPASAAAVSPRLQAILAEMPSTTATRSSTTRPRTAQSSTGSAVGTDADRQLPPATAPSRRTAIDDEAETTAERLRRITRDDLESPVPSPNQGERSTNEIHQELTRMPPRKLCETLGRVGTRTAILTLCGLPNNVADAAIACLPRAQANQVRQQLMALGNLEIRQIDQAKEQVAAAARVVISD